MTVKSPVAHRWALPRKALQRTRSCGAPGPAGSGRRRPPSRPSGGPSPRKRGPQPVPDFAAARSPQAPRRWCPEPTRRSPRPPVPVVPSADDAPDRPVTHRVPGVGPAPASRRRSGREHSVLVAFRSPRPASAGDSGSWLRRGGGWRPLRRGAPGAPPRPSLRALAGGEVIGQGEEGEPEGVDGTMVARILRARASRRKPMLPDGSCSGLSVPGPPRILPERPPAGSRGSGRNRPVLVPHVRHERLPGHKSFRPSAARRGQEVELLGPESELPLTTPMPGAAMSTTILRPPVGPSAPRPWAKRVGRPRATSSARLKALSRSRPPGAEADDSRDLPRGLAGQDAFTGRPGYRATNSVADVRILRSSSPSGARR